MAERAHDEIRCYANPKAVYAADKFLLLYCRLSPIESRTILVHCTIRRTHSCGVRRPIAQVRPRDILTASELTKAHDFLYEADLLVTDVKSLFRSSGDFTIAARLKDIQGRLSDEIRAVERLIAASKSVFRH